MIRQKIQEDQIAALKSGDKAKLEVLRYILAQIKNKEVDKKAELNDDETLDVIRKYVKQLNESIDAFEKGDRPQLAAESQAQKEIATQYLPQQLSDEALQTEIQKIIDANRELYEKNAKAIIGKCMQELKNKADSTRIMALLNQITG